MRILILLFFLMVNLGGFAQGPRALFKIAPLALIDDFGLPAVQGGLEFAITKKISWYNEVGIRYRKSLAENADTSFVTPGGYKLKSEVRYYFKDRKDEVFSRLHRHYLAINVFYINSMRNTTVNYYLQKDTNTTNGDDFGVTKKVWGGNLIVGYQIDISKRIMFECYGGLGIRVRDIVTVNREFDRERDRKRTHHHDIISNIIERPELRDGKKGMFNLSLGIRIAYKLF